MREKKTEDGARKTEDERVKRKQERERSKGKRKKRTAQPLAAEAASLIEDKTFKPDFSCGAAKC